MSWTRRLLGLWVYLSWLGLFIHNYIESVDGSTIAIGLISTGLFLAWWRVPTRRTLTVKLLSALGIIELIGAIVSVIPFSFLPFYPEQTVTHYLAHLVYGALQVPLVMATMRAK